MFGHFTSCNVAVFRVLIRFITFMLKTELRLGISTMFWIYTFSYFHIALRYVISLIYLHSSTDRSQFIQILLKLAGNTSNV